MKKHGLLLPFIIFALVSRAQTATPINNLPTQISKPNAGWIAVDVPGTGGGYTTKKMDINKVSENKLDSFYIHNDTIFGKKGNSIFYQLLSVPNALLNKVVLDGRNAVSIDTLGNHYYKFTVSDLINKSPFQVTFVDEYVSKKTSLAAIYRPDGSVGCTYFFDAPTGTIYFPPIWFTELSDAEKLQTGDESIDITITYYSSLQ